MRGWFLILAMLHSSLFVMAAMADDEELPLLHSVDGDRIVVLVTPQGNREIEAGARVKIGDRIRTGPRASAKIIFNDGTKLLIGRLTELEVQKPVAGTIPSGRLLHGQVRGVVPKLKAALEAAHDKPKFMLKTKSAVMGVRGTDFIYEAAENGVDTALHTLEGTVEVAQTELEVLEGRGIQVPVNHGVVADEKGISVVQRFNRQEFLGSVSEKQPFFLSAGQNDRSLLIQKDVYEAPPKPEPVIPFLKFELLQIQIGALYTKYRLSPSCTNNNCTSTIEDGGARFTWNPTLHLGGWVGVRGTLGFASVHSSEAGRGMHTLFGAALELDKINPIILSAGTLTEVWSGGIGSGSGPLLTVGWKISDDGFWERIVVHFSTSHIENITPRTCKDSRGKTFSCDIYESYEGNVFGLGFGFNL